MQLGRELAQVFGLGGGPLVGTGAGEEARPAEDLVDVDALFVQVGQEVAVLGRRGDGLASEFDGLIQDFFEVL